MLVHFWNSYTEQVTVENDTVFNIWSPPFFEEIFWGSPSLSLQNLMAPTF